MATRRGRAQRWWIWTGMLVPGALGLAGCGASAPADDRGLADQTAQPGPTQAPQAMPAQDDAPSDFGNAQAGASAPAESPATIMLGERCQPGHYVGTFMGMYRSAAWGNGTAPVMFATADFNGLPGFEFWLEATDVECPPASEFCADVVVKGGKLRGFATPFADPNASVDQTAGGLSVRFEIDLVGELDCTTGMFRGQLQNGCYDIATVLYRFDGSLEASYDDGTQAFVDGTWQAKEMPMPSLFPPDPNIGGEGQWAADYRDDSALPSAGQAGLCDGATGLDTPAP